MLELTHLRKLSFSSRNLPVLFSICFYQIHIDMTNDCVSITKTLMLGIKVTIKRYKKNARIKSKSQCKESKFHKNYVQLFSCTKMIAKHLTQTFILTCCPYFSIMLTIRSVILKSLLH